MILQKLVFAKHLEKGEKIFYAIHKHWIVIFKSALELFFFGIFVPWGIYLIGFRTPVFAVLVIGWSSLALIRFISVCLHWRANACLVTNMSLLAIQYDGFFSNTATRSQYQDIEGVAYEIHGVWPTVFRYGDLVVHGVSGHHTTFHHVANPRVAELMIAKYQGEFLKDREMHDAHHLKSLLSQMVSEHVRHRLK